jgi:hypothetical protein
VEQGLGHGHLQVVPDDRPGPRIDPHAYLAAKGSGQSGEHVKARRRLARLDLAEVSTTDTCSAGQGDLADPAVQSLLYERLSHVLDDPVQTATGDAGDAGPGAIMARRHRLE